MAEKNLVQKLAAAAATVGPVKKDGNNDYQHYNFQSESAIKDAVKSALEAQGLVIVPTYEVIQQYDRQSGKGGVNHFVDVLGTFTITDGTDSIVGTMPGSGQDTGEKAMMKATTAAQKYFYKQLFNITDTEPDPDTTNSNEAKGPIMASEQDIKVYQTMVADYAVKQNTDAKSVNKAVFSAAKVKFDSWENATADDLGKLKIELSKLMG